MSNNTNRVGLAAEGHKFIRRGNDFTWTHPNLLRATDVDCTDMNDEDFGREVTDAESTTSAAPELRNAKRGTL